jgi:hypothetical protein
MLNIMFGAGDGAGAASCYGSCFSKNSTKMMWILAAPAPKYCLESINDLKSKNYLKRTFEVVNILTFEYFCS